ncbi:MAG TPA: hypothetical protein ENI66_01295 [Candidatus Yonathbacteria bacterium]|nr:hypothetical protein [Candidatus Yonathbacteria bacterium]
MKIEVPYYSQFLDVEQKDMMPKACAIACLKMYMETYKKVPSIDELFAQGEKKGGYGPSGWYHDALVSLAKDYGFSAERKEDMSISDGVETLKESLKEGAPVIVSAVKYILGQTKFHMVLLVGFKEEGKELLGFYYHDPESINKEAAKNLFVPIETFKKEWRRMAIFVTK